MDLPERGWKHQTGEGENPSLSDTCSITPFNRKFSRLDFKKSCHLTTDKQPFLSFEK